MSEVVRFSVSLEAELLEAFDGYVRDGKFPTRSDAIRHLLRASLPATIDPWIQRALAIFPDERFQSIAPALLWARLPLQGLLIWWAWRATRERSPRAAVAAPLQP